MLLQDTTKTNKKTKRKTEIVSSLVRLCTEYDMCSDIRLHAYTTAVRIKKIGHHIADFHVWIIYPCSQENRMQGAGFGRKRVFGANCVWREAQRRTLTLNIDGDCGLLAVGRCFVGGAAGDLLSALDVGRSDVERAHRAFSSPISQQRLLKTHKHFGGFDARHCHSYAIQNQNVERAGLMIYHPFSSTRQIRTSDPAINSSLLDLSESSLIWTNQQPSGLERGNV